jgi:hypothetical protein
VNKEDNKTIKYKILSKKLGILKRTIFTPISNPFSSPFMLFEISKKSTTKNKKTKPKNIIKKNLKIFFVK